MRKIDDFCKGLLIGGIIVAGMIWVIVLLGVK